MSRRVSRASRVFLAGALIALGPTMVETSANGHGPARTVALRMVGREPPV